MLSTDTEGDEKDDKADSLVCTCAHEKSLHADVQKVTITTVHAAKGLEWPVVFIPAGKLPRSHFRQGAMPANAK
jgi:superfamily I DNA/RNA helicase